MRLQTGRVEDFACVIALKTPDEIEAMGRAGSILAEAHKLARSLIIPGLTTSKLDETISQFLTAQGAVGVFVGYPGPVPFPAATCVSVNEELVCGIPGNRELAEGDVVSVDIGCRLDGWCADAAWSYPVGRISRETQDLLETGESALTNAIAELAVARTWAQAARRMDETVKKAGFLLVADLNGHGIGRELHEDPQVLPFVDATADRAGFPLQPGLTFTIEPVVTTGNGRTRRTDNGWTIETADGTPGVHFEHTIAMTRNGPLVLTQDIAAGS